MATNSKIINHKEYTKVLGEIKSKIRSAQLRAAIHVNSELLSVYWDLGQMLVEKLSRADWGDKIVEQLSHDLMKAFPQMEGFSLTNLKYMRRWYQFYSLVIGQQAVDQLNSSKTIQLIANNSSENAIGQQAVDQLENLRKIRSLLVLVPWGHHIQILTKCRNTEEAMFYLAETIKNSWSRNVLIFQIESNLYKRQGKSINNFKITMPEYQSDLAIETLKNPMLLNFLGLNKDVKERDLEKALINNLKQFLLELGKGFAYVGNQYHLDVEMDDFSLDLLFYNFNLNRFVIFELKVRPFKPEDIGKLNFYINTVDEKIKTVAHLPTIGILLCKTPNKTVVEYSLRGLGNPMGIVDYELSSELPENLISELPTLEELELGLFDEPKQLTGKSNKNPRSVTKPKKKAVKKQAVKTMKKPLIKGTNKTRKKITSKK